MTDEHDVNDTINELRAQILVMFRLPAESLAQSKDINRELAESERAMFARQLAHLRRRWGLETATKTATPEQDHDH